MGRITPFSGEKWRIVEGCYMFMGEFEHSLDSKARIIVPSKFREGLGDMFVLTRGLDNCLFAYPMTEWNVIEAKLRELPLTKADARAFVRLFLSGATECEVDKQGRVVLPANLRSHAKIDKDVIVIGVSTRVEIWAKEVWEHYSEEAELDYEKIAENIVELGI